MSGPTMAERWDALERRAPWAVPLLAALWLAATAGLRPLMLPDEGRYVGVAWEMLRSGEWLTPTLDGLPYFHKPPLFYWITGTSLQLFGAHPWAARAAPLVGAWIGAMALHRFLRRWSTPQAAGAGLLVLLAMPLWAVGAQFANLDMLVAGFITATVTAMAHAVLSAEQGTEDRRVRDLAYVFAGFGVLAKGLIGCVLPMLVIGAWLLLRRRPLAAKALVSVRGLLLFALVAAPWFVVMQLRFDGFLHYFFVVQHVQRYAGTGFNNAQPVWFYPAVVALLSLPFLPWLRPALGRGFYADARHGAVRLLMLAWCLAVIAFFSMPRSKLIGYVLPAIPPLAALVAQAWSARPAQPGRWARGAWRASLGLGAAVTLVVVLGLALNPSRTTRELAAALAARHAAGEPVVALQAYPFDLPFLARLAGPLHVVDDWDSPQVQQMDNWRKELADAGRFDPTAARTWLVRPADLSSLACAAPVSWWIGEASQQDRLPFLAAAQRVGLHEGMALWRLERDRPDTRARLACGGPPSEVVTAP